MFELTKAAFKKTLEDFKKVVYVTGVATQIVYLIYLCYALIWGNANRIFSGILAGISFVYLVFYLIVTKFGKVPDGRENLKRSVALVVKWSKKLIALYNIGVMLYGISLTAKAVTPLALILNAMMLVGFILGVVFDVIMTIVKNRAQLFITGFEKDVATIKQPATNVGNFFKKITGQEIDPEEPKTKKEEKTIQLLQAIADKTKEEQSVAKQAKKERLQQKKVERALAKKQEKQAAKKLALKKRKQKQEPLEEIAASEEEPPKKKGLFKRK